MNKSMIINGGVAARGVLVSRRLPSQEATTCVDLAQTLLLVVSKLLHRARLYF